MEWPFGIRVWVVLQRTVFKYPIDVTQDMAFTRIKFKRFQTCPFFVKSTIIHSNVAGHKFDSIYEYEV